jgi:hypothetical protein
MASCSPNCFEINPREVEAPCVELSWEKVRYFGFPYALRINDAKVSLSRVPVENPGLIAIPVLLIFASLFAAVLIGMFASTL